MRHPLITDLLSKEVTMEYDSIWEDEIVEAHMNIALNSYDTGRHGDGYGSADFLSHLAENKEAKDHFRNLAYLYLDGYCLEHELMFSRA